LDIQIPFLTIQIVTLVTLVTLVGCKQRIDNPELVDPIYQDIVSETRSAQTAIATEIKEIKTVKEQLSALRARDSSRAPLLRELAMHERSLVLAKQNYAYLKVRSEQRRLYDIQAYERAFLADRPWPDQAEVAEFRKIKKLRASSRSWDDRVPKTSRYNRIPAGTEKKEEIKAGTASNSPKH